MAKLQPSMGDNRTGVARAHERCEEMLRGNEEFAPQPSIDDEPIAMVRQEYIDEGDSLGTIPPPASLKELGKVGVSMLKRGSPTLLVDKLGGRLAFERSGVRLYQALLSKLDTHAEDQGDGDIETIRTGVERVLEQEFDHFAMLKSVIEEMGGDPTAVTPSADVEATLSSGVLTILVDARANLVQSLEAMLVAELADNESWDQLLELAERQGNDDMVTKFEQARAQEREHLTKVRTWIDAARGLGD